MEKDNYLKVIDGHLEDIREQFEIIRAYEGKIPSIELDLIMANLQEVYDTFRQLEKLNQPVFSFKLEREAPAETPIAEPPPEVKAEEPAETPIAAPPPEVKTPEPVETPIAEPPPEVKTPEPDPLPPVEKASDPEPEKPVTTPSAESRTAKSTLDLFGESSSTLADRLKDTNEKRVADKLKPARLHDIRSAIGINEKFLFINELFDGSLKNYEDAISKLNDCLDGSEADRQLTILQAAFSWDPDNVTVISFTDLVSRKF